MVVFAASMMQNNERSRQLLWETGNFLKLQISGSANNVLVSSIEKEILIDVLQYMPDMEELLDVLLARAPDFPRALQALVSKLTGSAIGDTGNL